MRATHLAVHASTKYEVSLCNNRVCRRQGSGDVVKFGKDLALPDITITETGCLGRCGNGPNGMVYPGEVPIKGVATPADLTDVLENICGVTVPQAYLTATQMRLDGNSCAREGKLRDAVQLYTQGLEALDEAGCPKGHHLLYSNRSVAHLNLGDHNAALTDAMAAVSSAPEGWYTAWVRLIDAYFAMGRFADAADAVKKAAEACRQFRFTEEYKVITSALQRKGLTVAS